MKDCNIMAKTQIFNVPQRRLGALLPAAAALFKKDANVYTVMRKTTVAHRVEVQHGVHTRLKICSTIRCATSRGESPLLLPPPPLWAAIAPMLSLPIGPLSADIAPALERSVLRRLNIKRARRPICPSLGDDSWRGMAGGGIGRALGGRGSAKGRGGGARIRRRSGRSADTHGVVCRHQHWVQGQVCLACEQVAHVCGWTGEEGE